MPTSLLAANAVSFDGLAEKAAGLDQLHSLTILHHGETRFEEVFRGPSLEQAVNVKSVSKSIVALMTGIAIDRGILPGTDATLGALVPDLLPDDADPRVEAITIADLLTMQAGLERTSGPNYGAWVESPDWVRYVLTRPFEAEPGERFQYSTGSYHLLGVVIARLADRSLLDLAREWLGEPLDIAIPAWTRDPQGYYMGGNNMALSPRALAKIGELVRLDGRYGQTQVVPSDWIETSLVMRTRSPFSGDAYGFGWFETEIGGTRAVYARGYGGQMIYIMDDVALTIAVTSDPTRPARSDGHVGDLHDLVEEVVLPAITV
ncbi:beta-lactamase family protein [Acuticoccus sp. M5D2P5]|uniref:serine hydrolase domain-containing protein n=1 Tax=Acuticoccus kalidii TaxID=2910977 RepID=UPI001F47F93C|nr:serine hydrolase [Acuticoccus kalidii]MCF3934904.1 beta-lactamase family protein [Acuticoccus kalidii]